LDASIGIAGVHTQHRLLEVRDEMAVADLELDRLAALRAVEYGAVEQPPGVVDLHGIAGLYCHKNAPC